MRLRQPRTLTFATDFAFPPFALRSKKGDLVGFDVDVAKAAAKQMRLKVLFVNRGVGSLVPGALAHRHDLAGSGLRATPRLREEACVSAPYLDANLAVLVGSPAPPGIADASDLGDKRVGVLDGSRAADWAKENLSGSTVVPMPTTDDLLAAIRGRQVDAAVDELAIARFAAKQSRAFAVASRITTDEDFVFVTSPDNGELVRRVNAALARLERTGTLTKIQRKWFGG